MDPVRLRLRGKWEVGMGAGSVVSLVILSDGIQTRQKKVPAASKGGGSLFPPAASPPPHTTAHDLDSCASSTVRLSRASASSRAFLDIAIYRQLGF